MATAQLGKKQEVPGLCFFSQMGGGAMFELGDLWERRIEKTFQRFTFGQAGFEVPIRCPSGDVE